MIEAKYSAPDNATIWADRGTLFIASKEAAMAVKFHEASTGIGSVDGLEKAFEAIGKYLLRVKMEDADGMALDTMPEEQWPSAYEALELAAVKYIETKRLRNYVKETT